MFLHLAKRYILAKRGLYNIGFGNDFSDVRPKNTSRQRKKTDKLDFIKI
jgi:hypothetical protein